MHLGPIVRLLHQPPRFARRKLRVWCSRGCGEEGSLGCVTGRGEPSWQPIGGLPVIASLIDGGLRDGREHYAALLEARPKPYVLDDAPGTSKWNRPDSPRRAPAPA